MTPRLSIEARQVDPYVAWQWLVRQPGGVHIAMAILMGKTASHLPEHGLEATEDKTENVRQHIHAHRPGGGSE